MMRSQLTVVMFLGLLSTSAFADAKRYTLKAVRPAGTCIQVTGGRVVAGECSGDASLTWTVTPTAGGFHRIVSTTGSCLDIQNDGKTNSQVQLAACGNASGQLWKFTPFGSAAEQYLTTSWRGDGQCLGVFDDTKLALAECRQVANLRWKLEPAADRPRAGSRPDADADAEPQSSRPADNRADRDGALMTRVAWSPTFLVRTKPCSILLPSGSPDESRTTNYPLSFECQRNDAAVTCAIHTDLDSYGTSDYMFVAPIQKWSATTLQFATPKKLIAVTIDLGPATAAISQRLPDGSTASCTGRYTTVEADLAARRAAAAERRRQEDANGGPRSGPAAPIAPRATEVKGSAKGRQCSKDKDCQSGACAMENKTRGRCR